MNMMLSGLVEAMPKLDAEIGYGRHSSSTAPTARWLRARI